MNKINIFISTDGTEYNGYDFDDNYIKDARFADQIMDTSFNVNPCVIEQYAEFTFKDKNNLIRNLVTTGQLTKDMVVYVYIDDRIFNTYLTSVWDLKLQSTTVKLSCNDPVKKLENIQTQLINVGDYTLQDLLYLAFSWTPYSVSYERETYDLCANTLIKDTYIEYQDVLSFLNKLCLVQFLRIMWRIDRFVVERCW